MEIQQIKSLLLQVSAITKRYEKIAELNGENFNIFKVLKVERAEVKHSDILAEFLNPEGSHGQKDKFLQLFVESLKVTDFKTAQAKVNTEVNAGLINAEYSEGGRIDIVIDDQNGTGIIIENKIDANDQEKQLERYWNHGNRKFTKCNLLYLTLQEKNPSESSLGNLKQNNVQLISYKKEIIDWLELCRKEAAMHPILRETFTQYIHLLQYLTNQSTMEKHDDEIREMIINNSEYVNPIDTCFKVMNSMITGTALKFYIKLNELFPQQIIKLKDDKYIRIRWDKEDGIYIHYQYFDGEKHLSNSDQGREYYSLIKKFKDDVRNNQYNVIWYDPKPFKRGEKFEHLDKKYIIEMYKNPSIMDTLIEGIIKEAEEIRMEFLKRI